MVEWDEPRAYEYRAADEAGRIVGRVRKIPGNGEFSASVGYDELGVYVSEATAKAAVERALAAIESRRGKEQL